MISLVFNSVVQMYHYQHRGYFGVSVYVMSLNIIIFTQHCIHKQSSTPKYTNHYSGT